MWGSDCSCPLPCVSICYRRILPSSNPCCSYARGTPPPSCFPITAIISAKRKRKKKDSKQKMISKFTTRQLQSMTSDQIAQLTRSELDLMGPSEILLLSPSKQELIMHQMAELGLPLKQFEERGVKGTDTAKSTVDKLTTDKSHNYAGSEGGYVTRRCDPRCKARMKRPSTVGCSPRQRIDTAAYCGIGGIHKLDAATATDIKTNAATSTNNLFTSCPVSYPQSFPGILNHCNQTVQQQYNQMIQQQYLQNCYNCQLMSQLNHKNYDHRTFTLENQNNIAPHSQDRNFPQSPLDCTETLNPCSFLRYHADDVNCRSQQSPTNRQQLITYYTLGTPIWPCSITSSKCTPSSIFSPSLCPGKRCSTCGRLY